MPFPIVPFVDEFLPEQFSMLTFISYLCWVLSDKCWPSCWLSYLCWVISDKCDHWALLRLLLSVLLSVLCIQKLCQQIKSKSFLIVMPFFSHCGWVPANAMLTFIPVLSHKCDDHWALLSALLSVLCASKKAPSADQIKSVSYRPLFISFKVKIDSLIVPALKIKRFSSCEWHSYLNLRVRFWYWEKTWVRFSAKEPFSGTLTQFAIFLQKRISWRLFGLLQEFCLLSKWQVLTATTT